MKVIDLLNKIVNGEAPKKIKYHNYEFRLYSNHSYKGVNEKVGFFDEIYFTELNDEVEVIEEDKKIEKMSDFYEEQINKNGSMSEPFNKHELKIISKINEIIDYINKKGNDIDNRERER